MRPAVRRCCLFSKEADGVNCFWPFPAVTLPLQHVLTCLHEGSTMNSWRSYASPRALVAVAALFLVSCVLFTNAAIIAPTACPFGPDYVQVVSFITIKDEEIIRLGSAYDGVTGAGEGTFTTKPKSQQHRCASRSTPHHSFRILPRSTPRLLSSYRAMRSVHRNPMSLRRRVGIPRQ